VDDTLEMHYEEHYFGEPWLQPEVVLMVHGAAESGASWFAWVPHLARRYRVIRVDLRGSGKSSRAPAGFEWSLDSMARDLVGFLDAMGIGAGHLVGAKLGAAISLNLAGKYPQRLLSLSVLGAPVEKRARRAESAPAGSNNVASVGMREWAARSQRARLGSAVSQEQIEWWTDFMGAADPDGFAGLGRIMGSLENFWQLKMIKAPTLVVSTEGSALGDEAAVREWAAEIPSSELVILPGDSYHIAASEPDKCAQIVLDFVQRNSRGGMRPAAL
jgi:pimeloyl-ACP methyl ester carboxylesterase